MQRIITIKQSNMGIIQIQNFLKIKILIKILQAFQIEMTRISNVLTLL